MKKLLSIVLALGLLAAPAQAFIYEIKILTEEEIKKLSDEDLVEVFTEAKIEEKASSEFHEAAGFSSSKDYNKRKDLLRFLIHLQKEMHKRGIQPDPIDQWLR